MCALLIQTRLEIRYYIAFFLFAVLPLAPAEPNLATCAPREPPATWRCRYGFPAPSAPQGCFLNEAAFISGGLLTTDEGPGLAVVPDSAWPWSWPWCAPAILHRRREEGAREGVG